MKPQRRTLKTSCKKEKALENWKRPSIDELGVPSEPWRKVFDRNQKRYNLYLIAGTGFLGGTVAILANTVELNSEPAFLKKTGYVTKNLTDEQMAALSSNSNADSPDTAEEMTLIVNESETLETNEKSAGAEGIEAEEIAERAAAEEADKLAAEAAAAEEAARLAAEAAAAEEAVRLAAEEEAKLAAEAARIAAEEIAAKEEARLEAERAVAEEADKLAAEAAATQEAPETTAEEEAKLATENIAEVVSDETTVVEIAVKEEETSVNEAVILESEEK